MSCFRVGVVLVAIGLAGCDSRNTACTLIGCDDAFLVTVTAEGGLSPGRYDVRASDGEAVRVCTLAVSGCRSGTCQIALSAIDVSTGCLGYGPDGDGGVLVQLAPTEGEVTVDVSRDGVPVTSARLSPVYADRTPNGPDCGTVCRVATASVSAD